MESICLRFPTKQVIFYEKIVEVPVMGELTLPSRVWSQVTFKDSFVEEIFAAHNKTFEQDPDDDNVLYLQLDTTSNGYNPSEIYYLARIKFDIGDEQEEFQDDHEMKADSQGNDRGLTIVSIHFASRMFVVQEPTREDLDANGSFHCMNWSHILGVCPSCGTLGPGGEECWECGSDSGLYFA